MATKWDPEDYVGPHDEEHHAQPAEAMAARAMEAEGLADAEEYVGPLEVHDDAEAPVLDELDLHDKSGELVHHLEDSMHELEERRRLLTGEASPARPAS